MSAVRGSHLGRDLRLYQRSLAAMGQWPGRRWIAAVGVAVLTAFLIGVPTAIVHTPLFMRMLPTTWWDYPVWGIAAVLVGLTAATYVQSTNPVPETQQPVRRTLAATVLSGLAVGCPICNKCRVAAREAAVVVEKPFVGPGCSVGGSACLRSLMQTMVDAMNTMLASR